jgi:hypothetical protein
VLDQIGDLKMECIHGLMEETCAYCREDYDFDFHDDTDEVPWLLTMDNMPTEFPENSYGVSLDRLLLGVDYE